MYMTSNASAVRNATPWAGWVATAVKDNRDMRKISAAVALLAVPTTIAAIYGQNFDNMP